MPLSSTQAGALGTLDPAPETGCPGSSPGRQARPNTRRRHNRECRASPPGPQGRRRSTQTEVASLTWWASYGLNWPKTRRRARSRAIGRGKVPLLPRLSCTKSVAREKKTSAQAQTLAEALRVLTPASPEGAGSAKHLMTAQQPVVDPKAALARKLAAIKPPGQQVRESLAKAIAGHSETISKAAKQITLSGITSNAIHQQLGQMPSPLKAQLAQMALTPAWAAEAKMAMQPLSQAYLPLTQAAARAQMSPAPGGTFKPPSERLAEFGKHVVAPLASASLMSPIKMPRPQLALARLPTTQNPLLDPQLSVRRRRRGVAGPAVPSAAPARPLVFPHELGEAFAQGLMRTYRQEAEKLLVAIGLELELEHLQAIELRLCSGTRPDRLQAALSANHLLKGLADYLFPPREEEWESRFGTKHKLGTRNVSNRLSAFVDPVFRSKLTTQEHYLFQATLDFVFRWSGKGHHVVFTPREAAEAFCQLLKVLAAVARAHQVAAGSAAGSSGATQ